MNHGISPSEDRRRRGMSKLGVYSHWHYFAGRALPLREKFRILSTVSPKRALNAFNTCGMLLVFILHRHAFSRQIAKLPDSFSNALALPKSAKVLMLKKLSFFGSNLPISASSTYLTLT